MIHIYNYIDTQSYTNTNIHTYKSTDLLIYTFTPIHIQKVTIIHIYSVETQVVFAHDTNSFGTSTHILEGRSLPQGRGSGATEQVIWGGKWGPVGA